jgi:cytochrome b561
MEDTLAEGFKGHRQLPYAHWIYFLIFMALTPLLAEVMAELTSTTTEFPEYDLHQLMGSSTRSRTPRQQRC